VSRPDATAAAALDGDHIRPVWFGYLDIVGDPVRVNTSGRDMTLSGTGDADLDGQTFYGIRGDLISISQVRAGQGGSDTVTVDLSGLRGPDNDMLNTMGDKANWQGRVARLWRMIRNGDGVQQGAIQHFYTGYMVAHSIGGNAAGQAITIKIESYLAAFSQASNRTYLDQEKYDAGDLSAKAAIAIANGVSGNPIVGNTQTGGYSPADIGGPFAHLFGGI
jgi:hypothetical protein